MTSAWPTRLWRTLMLPLALVFVWQAWGIVTANPRTPVPTRVVAAALQLIESGEVPGPKIRTTGEGLLPPKPGIPDASLSFMGWMKAPGPEVASAAEARTA